MEECTPFNTLFLHYFSAMRGFTQGCAKEIVRTAFNAVSDLHFIVLVTPTGVFPGKSSSFFVAVEGTGFNRKIKLTVLAI